VNSFRVLGALGGYGLMAAAALTAPNPAMAQASVALDSAVFVERAVPEGRRLEPASALSRGDRVVYVVTWERTAGSGSFVVTNPLPRSVYFQESASGDEEVSVDGGRTWGKLGELRLGARFATPEDVTHVRWRVPAAEAARGKGRIAYSAIVR
jgi:hypothetical protein